MNTMTTHGALQVLKEYFAWVHGEIPKTFPPHSPATVKKFKEPLEALGFEIKEKEVQDD